MDHIVIINLARNTSKFTDLQYVKGDKIINIDNFPNNFHHGYIYYLEYKYIDDNTFIIYHQTNLLIIKDDSIIINIDLPEDVHICNLYILNNMIVFTNLSDNYIYIYDKNGNYINKFIIDGLPFLHGRGIVIDQYLYVPDKSANIYKIEITTSEIINLGLVSIDDISNEYTCVSETTSKYSFGLYKKITDYEKTIYVDYRNRSFNDINDDLNLIFLGCYDGDHYFFKGDQKQIVKGLYTNEIVEMTVNNKFVYGDFNNNTFLNLKFSD